MNVFEVVKENVTARQAAEAYGLKVGRTGMACCPFHSDKSPSMKLDERYYCFGCGATGDAVDLTAKLFGIGLREAAVKLAEDFGLNYDSRQKPSVRPRIREPTPEQKYQKGENHCYKVLTDYFHLLREWEKKYAPKQPDEEWNPLKALELLDYRERHPASLSGGQKQRVTIGAAIVKGSPVIYFDEPTSGLDYDSMVRVSKLIEQLSSSGVIVFVVSHDFEFIVRTCTEVVQLDDDGAIQNQRLSPEILKTLSEKYFN